MKLIHTADICLDRCFAEQALPAEAGAANRAHLRERFASLLERARTISARRLGPAHVWTARVLRALGEAHAATGDAGTNRK